MDMYRKRRDVLFLCKARDGFHGGVTRRERKSVAALALNIPLAGFGGALRFRNRPLVPLMAAGKAAAEAAAAGWYFYQMPAKEKAWCGYCITGAAVNFGIFALALPEAVKAWRELRRA